MKLQLVVFNQMLITISFVVKSSNRSFQNVKELLKFNALGLAFFL